MTFTILRETELASTTITDTETELFNVSDLSNYIDEYLKTEYTLKSTLKDSVQSRVYLYQKNDSEKQIIKISQKNRNDHVLRRLRGQHHKNTATVYEVCSNDNDVTLLEEYIHGVSLGSIVKKSGGTLENELAVKYALDICMGLVFMHSLGIIHRDIKPSNIIINEQGEAVIIDFGIARLIDDNKYSDTKNLGTAGYAAPEQFGIYQSGPVTDIYAVGVLLNELILGVHPTIDTPNGKLGKIINKCIMAQMSKRYQHVSELAEVLNKLL
ncbi:MAG TPA: hypothetical protein DCQ76_03790 [Ruminococcaceae bacterium]|nr:hypothetical protein [Oscillospiraceae bacterium]